MSRLSKLLTALVPALLVAAPSSAATFTTPLVATNSHQPVCLVTNIGTKPIRVTAALVSGAGSAVMPVSANCPVPPATLAPQVTCQAAAPVGQDVYCVVETSSAKVRAGITLFTAGGDFAGFVPATR